MRRCRRADAAAGCRGLAAAAARAGLYEPCCATPYCCCCCCYHCVGLTPARPARPQVGCIAAVAPSARQRSLGDCFDLEDLQQRTLAQVSPSQRVTGRPAAVRSRRVHPSSLPRPVPMSHVLSDASFLPAHRVYPHSFHPITSTPFHAVRSTTTWRRGAPCATWRSTTLQTAHAAARC